MATVLQRTGSGAYYGKMTISFWVKRSKLGEQGIFGRREGSATANLSTCHFGGDDSLLINFRDGGGTSKYYMITDRLFRDVGAWYHIVFAIDGTHATASERSKLYVNGVRETSFQLLNNPSSTGYEVNMFVGGSYNTYIGRGLKSQTDTWLTFEGCMSHFHCSTGYTYDADVFGSTDSVTGEWKIKNPTFTPGTDGFTVLKDGNTITDQSANSNNFTVYSGTLTKTEDCPSNVFCTLNPLSPQTYTFSNGNNTIVRASGTGQSTAVGTLAVNSGKYYWEVKLNSGQSDYPRIGIFAMNKDNHVYTTYLGNHGGGSGKWWGSGGTSSSNKKIQDGNGTAIQFYPYDNGDILMFALDCDNEKVWFGKNGTWYTNDNSTTTTGTAISNNTATPAFSNVSNTEMWTPAVFGNASGDNWSCNFGNGYFGTTAISSEGTNASGNGIFEYDVPTGFTALSTKGLNL